MKKNYLLFFFFFFFHFCILADADILKNPDANGLSYALHPDEVHLELGLSSNVANSNLWGPLGFGGDIGVIVGVVFVVVFFIAVCIYSFFSSLITAIMLT